MATVHSVNIKATLDAKQAQQEAEKLHKTIKATKADAANMHTSSGGQSALNAAKKNQAATGAELALYGNTRAMRPGGTGASARDFAQEAQGLGGLVRLYATYAANVFAVAAAFNALQAAQDTTNMVKGLDQLGASSGVALGSLAKQLVKATDGAVSLREAMEATVKASSSGMVSKDILRMADVAKKAAQALGINMPDALSRISRGITKLEPELLDELGIFTRIDPAVKAYAASVNKSVTSLTDFERRMAFSNAVLKEGEEKFSKINIATNAYTQLLANLKNSATEIGSAINSVLVPIVNVLNTNPMALYTLIFGMAAMVVKQAVPALASFNTQLKETQKETAKASASRMKTLKQEVDTMKKLAEQKAKDSYSIYVKEADDRANAAVAAVERAEARINALKGKASSVSSAAAVKAITGDNANLGSITKEQVENLEAYQAKLAKEGRKSASVIDELAKSTRALYDTNREYEIAEEARTAAGEKASNKEEETLKKTVRYRLAEREYLQQRITLSKNNIAASAAESVHTKGYVAALREASDAVDSFSKQLGDEKGGKPLSAYRTGVMKLAAGISVTTSALTGLMGVLGTWAEVAGLALVALGFLDAYMDKASKQVSDLYDGYTELTTATKTYNEVINNYNTAKFEEAFSVKALSAYSLSLLNIADSIEKVDKKLSEARVALNDSAWSRGKNSMKEFFGFGIAGEQKDSYTNLVKDLLNSVKKSPESLNSFNKSLKSIFGVDNINKAESLAVVVQQITDQPEKRNQLILQIKDAGIQMGIASDASKTFKKNLDTAVESANALGNSFKITTPLSKLADDTVTLLDSLDKIPSTVEGRVDSLNNMFSKMTTLDLFGDSVGDAKKLQLELADITAQYDKLKVQQTTLKEAAEKSDLTFKSSARYSGDSTPFSSDNSMDEAMKRASIEFSISTLTKQAKDYETRISSIYTKAYEFSKKGLANAYDILERQIVIILSKPLNAFKNAVTATMGDVIGVAKRNADSARSDLDYQATQIKMEAEGVLYLRRIAAATELAAAQSAAQEARKRIEDAKATKDSDSIRFAMQAANPVLAKEAAALKTFETVSRIGLKSQDAKELVNSKDPKDRSLAFTIAGALQSLAGIGDQKKAVGYKQGYDTIGEAFNESTKSVSASRKGLEAEKQRIALLVESGQLYGTEAIKQQSSLNIELLKNDSQAKSIENAKKLAQIDELIAKGGLTTVEKKRQEEVRSQVQEAERIQIKQNGLAIDQENLSVLAQSIAFRTKERLQSEKLAKATTDISNSTNSLKLDLKESNISKLESLGIDTRSLNLALESARLSNDSNARTKELTQSQKANVATLFDEWENASDERMIQIEAELNASTNLFNVQLESERLLTAASQDKLSAQKELMDLLIEQEKRTENLNTLSTSLSAIFDKASDSVQGFVKGLGESLSVLNEIATRKENTALQEIALNKKLNRALETNNAEDEFDAYDQLQKLKKKSAQQTLKDDASLLNSSKKLFKEKTTAYKILDTLEKVKHLQIMYNMGVQLATTISTAFQAAVSMTPAVMMQFLSQLGPWGMAAGAAAVAQVLGGSRGSGFTANAEQLQKTQGTSQKYDSNGNLVSTPGGVLGDQTAINKDISVGIENLTKLTFLGFNTNQSMLKELEKIQYNTQGMTAGLYRIPGLMGGKSGFGTVEKSTPGFLGLFAKSTAIIDTGVKFLKGQFQQYETIQTTKSGFLGIGGGTKTSQNIKALDDQVNNDLNRVFDDLLKTASKSIEALNLGISSTLNPVLRGLVDLEGLTISLKGLDATAASEAISGVLGNTVSLAIQEMYPFLEAFRKVGEGMLATALRVGAEMDYVNKAMQHTGMNFSMLEIKQTEAINFDLKAIEQARLAKENAIKAEAAAKKKVADMSIMQGSWEGDWHTGQDTGQILEYAAAKQATIDATNKYTEALKGTSTATQDTIRKNIEMTQALLDGAGGIDKLVDQVNFMSITDKNTSAQSLYTDQIADINNKLKGLTISTSVTQSQFTELVRAQDLTTEAGRENWQLLMDLAPAYKAAADSARDAIDAINTTAQSWAEIQDIRNPGSGNTLSEEANIIAAFNKYKLTDRYSIANAEQFRTITEADFKKNYQTEQQGYITTILKGYATIAENKTSLAIKAAEDALNVLKRSVEDQKKLLEDQLKVFNDSFKNLESLLDLLDTNIRALRDSVDSTTLMSYNTAKDFISNAAFMSNLGILPDKDELSKAITSVRTTIDKGNFIDKFQQDKAKLILANQLEEVQSQGLVQKSGAEKQIDLLEDQLKALNDTYTTAEKQVNELKGINTSVLSVVAAIANLTAILTTNKTGNTNSTAGTRSNTGDFVIGGTTTQSNRASFGAGTWNAESYLIKNADVGGHYLANKAYIKEAYNIDSIQEWADWHYQNYGIAENRAFAQGGAFTNGIVNSPTMFNMGLMGEAGPEAIMPLARDSSGTLGVRGSFGSDIALEIRELRKVTQEAVQSNKDIKAYLVKIQNSSQESADLLDEVVRGGTPISVKNT